MDTLPLPPRGERGRKQIDEIARTCAKKESAAALLFFSQQHQDNAVHDARERAEHDDWPRDDEHLRRHAGDETLCLCQDRDEGNFCPILLSFWLLKFLKKSAFFAKLL